MICKHCRTENSDGREFCEICGKPLLNIRHIMEVDRWAGRVLRGLLIGIFVGGAAGSVFGALIAPFIQSRYSIGEVFIGLWIGVWPGSVLGALVGGIWGLLSSGPPPSRM